MAMDVILLGLIPIALLKDFCCQSSGTKKKKKQLRSKLGTIFTCVCFTIIFLVDALIFNTVFGL